ncbi:hypothetical protein CFRA_02270 [Corynebacterium frankenforstense DSM 45800]|uniref:EccD-like transmembrane domain-containing protein n=1 Tax=Corynebacterium frankenforstense DSM 45800 TaxID=1437875 RepID=A0A1L7CR21_9CORY|nr:type VII secretion integral membrane protein EccD [Corynebacterium frankenforstense]APT88293.1 hypothetical protein CFRA_02270 [Corynebacterium frankenforstense DSM 45800]
METEHVLRLCVRVHTGGFHRETDLSVPVSSSVADIAEEVAWLVGAPHPQTPWQATTAAGAPVPPEEPLGAVGPPDGGVLVLAPGHPSPRPVPRDAAEALADAALAGRAHPGGLAQATAATGVVMLAVLVAHAAPAWLVAAVAATACLLLLAWRRELTAAAMALPPLCGLAASGWVLGGTVPEDSSGWAAALGAGLAAAGVGLAAVAALRPHRPGAGCLAAGVVVLLVCACATGAGVLSGATGAATVAVAVALICGWAAPAIAQTAAGLSVPRLPTAGEEVTLAGVEVPDAAARAGRARRVHAGVVCGAAAVAVAALPWLAWTTRGSSPAWFALAFTLCVAAACGLHALRHADPVALWANLAVALAGLVAAAPAATGVPGAAPVALGITGAVAAAALTAPLWAGRLSDPEPTTLVWWERAESTALAAAVPLAAHLAGVFTWLRALG